MPSVIEWPNHVEPRISHVPAGTVDIYPTLLELAGAERPDNRPLDGISLMPYLEGRMPQRSQPLEFWHYINGQIMRSDGILRELHALQEAGEPAGDGDINDGRLNPPDVAYPEARDRAGPAAWIDGDWKLHRRANGQYLLFNLADDKGERNELSALRPDHVEQMRAELEVWQASVIDSMHGAAHGSGTAPPFAAWTRGHRRDRRCSARHTAGKPSCGRAAARRREAFNSLRCDAEELNTSYTY